MTPSHLTCIHSKSGLCKSCQDEYDIDPTAWIEFGDHPEGIARWKAEQERIAADRAEQEAMPVAEVDWGEIPF